VSAADTSVEEYADPKRGTSAMNEPRDPNLTADVPASAAASQPASNSLATVDEVRNSAGTQESSPATHAPTEPFPIIPGYCVLREIARGGMGRVLAAYELGLDRDVAVKVLLPGANSRRFVRESKITARLPHPGIPPVYALGTLDDGSPFLAMKLVEGQTLAVEMKTGDRPRLVQVFAQLCQAVGFAHSRGVIHRDLKPSNVMVGAFGEVQVMDWGLAKELTNREVADETRTAIDDSGEPLGESTDHRTKAGSVMGTPGYMSPEQARGEPADVRSDVFALGGMLCAILTGHAPFRGKTSREVIQQAASGELGDAFKRLDSCGADAELVALCRRCLSAAPVDRPATGQAVADELAAYLNGVQERLQTIERERAVAAAKVIEERRRRKVLLVAASLVVLVLVAGVISTTLAKFKADTEYQRAEARSADFRDLAMNMANQINQLETGAKDPRQVDLARRQALDDARGQFDRVREGRPEDTTVQLQAAVLHRYHANVSRMLSDNTAAENSYAKSIQILEELTTRFPDEPKYRDALAQTLADRALLEMLRGRLNDAAATLDRAWSIAENPFGPERESAHRRTLGWIDHDRAKIAYLRGRFEDAARFAVQARERLDKLKATKGVTDQMLEAIDPLLAAMAVNDLALARCELGNTTEAMAAHDDAVARMKELEGPKAGRDVVYWVCEVREQRARTAVKVPDQRAAAEADLVELGRIAEKLVDDNPQLAHYRQKLAAIHLTRGELLTALGRPEQAVGELTKSLTVSRALLDRFGVTSASLLVRGQTYLALGRAQAVAGKTGDAQAAWKNAAKVFEIALKLDPDNYHHRRGLTEAEAALKPPAK
jgi:tetratricopeptide (TPR) repeat protein